MARCCRKGQATVSLLSLSPHSGLRHITAPSCPLGLRAHPALWLSGQPVQGAGVTPMSPTAGPTARAAPARAQNGSTVDAAVERPGYYPLSPLWTSATAANAAPRQGHGDMDTSSPALSMCRGTLTTTPGASAPDASLPQCSGKGTDVVRAAVTR